MPGEEERRPLLLLLLHSLTTRSLPGKVDSGHLLLGVDGERRWPIRYRSHEGGVVASQRRRHVVEEALLAEHLRVEGLAVLHHVLARRLVHLAPVEALVQVAEVGLHGHVVLERFEQVPVPQLPLGFDDEEHAAVRELVGKSVGGRVALDVQHVAVLGLRLWRQSASRVGLGSTGVGQHGEFPLRNVLAQTSVHLGEFEVEFLAAVVEGNGVQALVRLLVDADARAGAAENDRVPFRPPLTRIDLGIGGEGRREDLSVFLVHHARPVLVRREEHVAVGVALRLRDDRRVRGVVVRDELLVFSEEMVVRLGAVGGQQRKVLAVEEHLDVGHVPLDS